MGRARVIALILALASSGCVPGPTPTLRLGTNVWIGYEPLYLARELGELPRERIRLVEYPSATEVMRALRNHSLEAASLTLDEVLQLRQDDMPVQIVLVHDVSAGGDVILARPEITDVTGLVGKRVGVEASALGAFMLTRALESTGVSPKDLDVVSLDVNTHADAYRAGDVDAVVTFEPVRTTLLADGAREIFSSRAIPNEIVDVLVVHEDFLASHPDIVQELVDGWFRALEFMQAEPESAAKVIARRLKLPPEDVPNVYRGVQLPSRADNLALLGGTPPALTTTIESLARILQSHELLARNVDTRGLLNARFVAGHDP